MATLEIDLAAPGSDKTTYAVSWHTINGRQFRHFDTAAEANAFALKKDRLHHRQQHNDPGAARGERGPGSALPRNHAGVHMTQTPHTPGPWDYFVGNSDGRGLIRIEQHGTGEHIASMHRGDVSEANARLMAAAPETTEVLKNLLALAEGMAIQIEGEWGCGKSLERLEADGELEDEIIAARAVLAKATGAP